MRVLKSLIITFLGDRPGFIPLIAQWHQDEWQHISPHLTTKKRIQLYQSYTNAPVVPSCLVAIIDNKPAGTASLVLCDMDNREHLKPWLASVYVHPDYRCQGVAGRLIQQCLENARKTGAEVLYLFTPDQQAYYAKRGWQLIEDSVYHGENVKIMQYDLSQIDESYYQT